MADIVTLEPVAPRPLAVIDKGLTLSTAEVIERTKRIREVMEAVMKPNVHYGIIPGTPKPTMFQPGADVLNVTFRIAPKIARIEDLGTDDEVRYRIIVQGVHQTTGEILAEGIGECSSSEEKYRYRRAVCQEEWDDTPTDRRREKWSRGKNDKAYKTKQVRTSPADVANTVLKMAVKRAKVAMTISATAASDVFAQDLEDLSEELRDHLAEEQGQPAEAPKPAQRVSEQKNGGSAPIQAPETPRAAVGQTSPAAPASPAPASATNVGIIETIADKGHGAALIMLNTGFTASTRDADMQTAAARLRDQKRLVELDTTPSADPSKYAPKLVGIMPLPESAS